MAAGESGTGADAPRRGGIRIAGTVAVLLLAIGGLNWGLVGLADIDLVDALFGRASVAGRVVYVLIGAAAVYCLFMLPRWSRAG